MRLFPLIAASCLAAGALQASPAESTAAELLASWAPQEISVSGNTLTARLPQRRISETIYLSTITAGLCLGPILGKSLPGVSEIAILNQFGAQGYVYEGGLEGCAELNNKPVGDPMIKLLVLGKTHLY